MARTDSRGQCTVELILAAVAIAAICLGIADLPRLFDRSLPKAQLSRKAGGL